MPVMVACTVLVPLRSPGRGKTRLAEHLSPAARASLAGAMLSDVAAALADAAIDELVVVAGGQAAAAAAAALGLDALIDPPEVATLDGALRAATGRIGPRPELLVVAADLPRLTAGDLAAVRADAADVVVAPTVDGGTGVLLRRPADVVPTRYGVGSAARHLALARRAGVTASTVRRAGAAYDVDTLADLTALRDAPVGPATRRLVTAWGMTTPLATPLATQLADPRSA
jgi:2-phospho-L-lactate/phosphoenolpyruvate guanylyltransferase